MYVQLLLNLGGGKSVDLNEEIYSAGSSNNMFHVIVECV